MLKAYSVFEEGYRQEHTELVFANTGKEARSLAWKRPHGDFCCDWIDLRVNRVKEADYLAGGKTEPFVCHDDAMFREAGWRGEDCSSCDSCGLTDFSDGENRQWAVCPECGQCGECGHDDDCISAYWHEDCDERDIAKEAVGCFDPSCPLCKENNREPLEGAENETRSYP